MTSIKFMRKAVGLPAVTLAELLDTSPETVSRREARARRPEEGDSTRPPFVEPGRSQPVRASQPYDQLPKGAIALHQGVRLPHVAEVEGARAKRWNSPRRDSFGDCSQRRVGKR